MDNEEIKKMVKACREGDLSSRREFQTVFGELIYNYPVKVFKVGKERAGDFYIYAFEEDRIYKRLANFKGERISAENYLRYIVLKDLGREWLRSESGKIMETAEMDDPDSPHSHEKYDLEKFSHKKTEIQDENTPGFLEKRDSFFELLEREDFLILKLLYVYDLTGLSLFAEDIRRISHESGKPIIDVIAFASKIQKKLDKKVDQKEKIRKARDKAFFWILVYHRNLIRIEEDMGIAEENKSFELGALKVKRDELKRKVAKRLRQIDTFAENNPDTVITTPYKDIADFFGIPVGAVSGRIARAKAKFALFVQEENRKIQPEKESEIK
jgi:RNA polymerase sigma factor (sigma-70 family)